MKKILYYIIPFVAVPVISAVLGYLALWDFTSDLGYRFITSAVFFAFAAVMGILSPSKLKVDVVISLLIPTAIFLTLFFALLFDADYSEGAMSLSHALNGEYYLTWLPLAIKTAVVSIWASFAPIRNLIKRKPKVEN